MRVTVNIYEYWPKRSGRDVSVYSVLKRLESEVPHILVKRYTLTRAKEGLLEKCDLVNLVNLTRICSYLSGETVSVEQILKIEE